MANPLQQLFPASVKRGARLDWPNEHADRGYIIFFTGRCGSTELVDVLTQSKKCGAPDEFFNEEFIPHHNAEWHSDSISDYIENLVKHRSAGGTFGFKVDGFRHRQLCDFIDPTSFFPKTAFKYIYLNRRNLLEQAYSYAHAKKTGVWHSKNDASPAAGPIDISDANIWREVALILEQEFYFERYIIENSMDVLRIDYETLCASKFLLIADVMLTLGCRVSEVTDTIASLRENYRKLKYDASKLTRLIDFRNKYGQQLSYLTTHRGRLPLAAARNYVRIHTGVDISKG